MSIITAMFANKINGYEEAFRAADITSDAMKSAISEWYNLFYDSEANTDYDPCQKIPYTVVSKITKTVFGEYTAQVQSEFLQSVNDALNANKIKALHAAMTGGRAFIKPTISNSKIGFSIITRPAMLIFGKDDQGQLNDVGTAEKTAVGNRYYTLLERRTVDARGYLTIKNMLYESYSKDILGTPIRLQSLDKYADMLPEYTYQEPIGLGMTEIRCPVPNCIDDSDDPVSVFAAAVGLIRNINRNEALLNGEFDRGESRIIVSDDMLVKDNTTGRKKLRDKVFVGLDESAQDVGITIFSPALREQSFLARKKEYLRDIENVIGLKRGLLSEVEAVERTATEVTSSEGEYALTIGDFQQMWETAAREAIVMAGRIGQLYHLPGAHNIAPDDLSIDWGNGVLYDEDKTWADYKDMVARGLIKPELAVGWRFNEPTNTEADLQKIRSKYMPMLTDLAGGDM